MQAASTALAVSKNGHELFGMPHRGTGSTTICDHGFKYNHHVTRTAVGAYWRGDEKRAMLQRVYGTAWESPQQLSAYVTLKVGGKLWLCDAAGFMPFCMQLLVPFMRLSVC